MQLNCLRYFTLGIYIHGCNELTSIVFRSQEFSTFFKKYFYLSIFSTRKQRCLSNEAERSQRRKNFTASERIGSIGLIFCRFKSAPHARCSFVQRNERNDRRPRVEEGKVATVLIAFPAQFTFNQRESPLATLRAICLSLKSLPLFCNRFGSVHRSFLPFANSLSLFLQPGGGETQVSLPVRSERACRART